MIRLTKSQVLLLHSELIKATGGIDGVRDNGLLDSALESPFQTFSGNDIYQTLQQKAARLGYSLIQNHPFIDGNKRIGVHTMLTFLSFNGIEISCTQNELADMGLRVASGNMSADDLVEWICVNMISYKK